MTCTPECKGRAVPRVVKVERLQYVIHRANVG